MFLTRQARLAKNIPTTIDNSRIYDSSSYLTADPALLRAAEERAAEASRLVNQPEGDGDEDEDMDEDEEEEEEDEEPEAGPSRARGKAVAAADGDAEEDEDEEGDEEEDEAEDEEEEQQQAPPPSAPPRILLTTSPGPSKPTYAFCDDLRSVFPGGEFFKRPKGRGYELGRVARWGAKRGYNVVMVVNENHKKPSEST